jgi:hypothetical protein
MQEKDRHMKLARRVAGQILYVTILLSLLNAGAARGQEASVVKSTRRLMLGETVVKVHVYEKKGDRITLFAPHHNERIAQEAAREILARHGGRFVLIESLDERGQPARRLRFASRGKIYSLDPNRIYTENGRRCGSFPAETTPAVANFAGELLDILLAREGTHLREGERFIVAVHNNNDVESRSHTERAGDLTAAAFAKAGRGRTIPDGAFHEQAAGVYLSNLENDEDNFVLLSTPTFLSFFADRGFNIVVQKPAAMLRVGGCDIDDGSLSVFSSLQNIPYINLEADALTGDLRQRQMLEAVYQLLSMPDEK